MPRRLRLLVVFANNATNATLSYQVGWAAAFRRSATVDATLVNVAETRGFGRLFNELRVRRRGYDAIVLLHSTFSNALTLGSRMRAAICRHPAPKVFFVGNEYKLMPQKMEFAEEMGVRLLVSQTSNPSVLSMYAERLGCPAVFISGGGLDTAVFRPVSDFRARPIDIGMRAHDEPIYFGHQERRALASYFLDRAAHYRLNVDISFDGSQRFTPVGYAAFLNTCRGQLGTESGTDYFDLDDSVRSRVNAYVDTHPESTFEQLRSLVFDREADPVSCRMLTGRHIEAAGTKTVQILFDGHYNGLFQPDVHYIALRKDFSNADDVIARFRDDGFCGQVVDRAYDVVMTHLTYEKLLDQLETLVRNVLTA